MSNLTKKSRTEWIVHPIEPFYRQDSRILILGSFPSVKSRESRFFYGHPQNRFWKVTSAVFEMELPETIEEKKEFLAASRIALWDSIHACTITGSSDASIRDVEPNDIRPILEASEIRRIFCNGAASHRMYEKYLFPVTGIEAIRLPSTSPANAAWSLDRLIEAWSVCREV